MSERSQHLQATADRQISELIDLLSALDPAALGLPCPGREKLGDGTVAAATRHTADNYERIATFVQAGDHMSGAYRPAVRQDHDRYTDHGADSGQLVDRLSTSREKLRQIATLTDSQLEAIPPDGSFRFCDGLRTLDQVLAGLLKHQGHQVESLKAALLGEQ